ncbi:tonB-system energizer ExbB [Acetobacteraceae bacterium ESL0709]|nr:tonB-system energizer ExbB [Acetobacteraceae bacterium ESL0697]MDF7677965.1 tonB-system energizer ExbB [Acetobacteraceae bacterium ESL0709]
MPAFHNVTTAFSPWDMFLNAGPLVRSVMILLILASLLSWTVFIAKTLELRTARKKLLQSGQTLEEAASLEDGRKKIKADNAAHILIMAACNEQEKSYDIVQDREGLKERISLHLERLEAAEGRRLGRGISLLATIGATAPFIGLFGTVWGIMTSFTGIAASKATSLSVVAPGIAEALLATAFGLIAAIPAVIIYNYLLRQTAYCRALLADLTTQIMRLVSRDLSRQRPTMAEGKIMPFSFAPRLAGE